MTVEEAMDLNSDSEMGDEPDDDDRDQNDVDDEDSRQPSTDIYPQESPIVPVLIDPPTGIQKMSSLTSDPRRRRPSEDQDLSNGWEPHMDRANVGSSFSGWTTDS